MLALSAMIAVKSISDFCALSGADCLEIIRAPAKKNSLSICINSCAPFFSGFIPINPMNTGCIVFPNGLIFPVNRVASLPKVMPSIIISNVVNMVYLFWHFSNHIKKRHTMSKISTIIYCNFPISAIMEKASNFSLFSIMRSCQSPSKYTGFRIIMKKFFKTCLSYNFIRHWLTPNKSLLGDRVLVAPYAPIISHI